MKQNKPVIVGLTGTIGSGKSTCSKILKEEFGLPVIDADQLAYSICEKDGPGLKAIAREFGPEFILENGEYNRELMSETVFNNSNELKRLNECLHPIIKEEKEKQLKKFQNSPVIIYDCPLLFEAGEVDSVDKILVITTDDQTRRERLKIRNNYSDQELDKRLGAQKSDEFKINQADAVIYNNGTLEDLQKILGNYLKNLIDNKN